MLHLPPQPQGRPPAMGDQTSSSTTTPTQPQHPLQQYPRQQPLKGRETSVVQTAIAQKGAAVAATTEAGLILAGGPGAQGAPRQPDGLGMLIEAASGSGGGDGGQTYDPVPAQEYYQHQAAGPLAGNDGYEYELNCYMQDGVPQVQNAGWGAMYGY
jgi:hypothetical protein